MQVADDELPCSTMFVLRWVDYSSKYGLGFLLSDERTAGVHFNDRSVMVYKDGSPKFYYLNYPSKLLREFEFGKLDQIAD
jgi:hypothetical protein